MKFFMAFGIMLLVFLFFPQISFSNVDCCKQEEVCIYDTYPNDSEDRECCDAPYWCTWNLSLWCQDFYMQNVASCPLLAAPCETQGSQMAIYQNQYGWTVTRTAWRYERVPATCDEYPPLYCGPVYQWIKNTNNNCTTTLCNNDICPCS